MRSCHCETGMTDRDTRLEELKRQFQDPRDRPDITGLEVQRYEAESDPKKRDSRLLTLWNWSLCERWAWDVLIELCRRTKHCSERPRTLNDFAILVAIGDRKPPDQRPGRPVNDLNSDFKIVCTVRMLMEDFGLTKTDTCTRVADWSMAPGVDGPEPESIRKLVLRFENRSLRPLPRSRAARN